MVSIWSKFINFFIQVLSGVLVFCSLIYIGLHKFIKGFFLFLNWLVDFPHVFLGGSLGFLHFLDIRLSEGLVKFIGFITPRSEFLTITLYLIFSVPLSVLKILFYFTFYLLKMLSFFPWFLKVSCFALLVPPFVYAYDLCSLVMYYTKIFYYLALSWVYKFIKMFIRAYIKVLEFRLFRYDIGQIGHVPVRELNQIVRNIQKRFLFEQFGSVSSSKVDNYYNHSETFDLDKYFLGPIPYSVYVTGRYVHEHNKFHSIHRLIHNARFFYQPLKKRKLVRFSYPTNRGSVLILEDPAYNTVRVFEYHRYISMGLVNNFNFSSFPEYYRSKLFSRLLRFNFIPAVNFYYNLFYKTLRNKGKNPDFWVHYKRTVTSPSGGLAWFEYSKSILLKDPIFSYNNHDYLNPSFGQNLSNKLMAKNRFREFSVSEGSRFSFDDHRSATEVGGKLFVGSHFSQFVDDYDHYLKTKVLYKSRVERFWFKRVLFPDSGLALDKQSILPALLPGNQLHSTYRRQLGSFLKIVFTGVLVSIVGLYGFVVAALVTFYKFIGFFLLRVRQILGDFIFRFYFFSIFFILRLPFLFVRRSRVLAYAIRLFTYPLKVSPFSIFWSFVVFTISLQRALSSVLGRLYAFVCASVFRVCKFITSPLYFLKFLFICVKEGNLTSLVSDELDILYKESSDFFKWLVDDTDK